MSRTRVPVRSMDWATARATVAPGEAFALVGPDAAGKTTIMRLLVGIMDPDEGEAQVLGFDTVKDS